MRPIKAQLRSVVLCSAALCCAFLVHSRAEAQPKDNSRTDVQSATKDWGYLRDADSQKLLDRAREIRRGMVSIVLEPDQQTDEVLGAVTLATDGNGHRMVGMTGSLGAESKDFFWVVDPRTGKYRTIKLTHTDADARRIHQLLGEKLPSRAQVSLDRVQERLAEARSRKQARTAERLRRADARRKRAGLNLFAPRLPGLAEPIFRNAVFKEPAPGFAGLKRAAMQDYPVCSGGGEAAIGTFDPLFIQLTDTYTWTDWWFNGYGDYYVLAGGSCWANPETFVGTHWYVAACSGELSTSVSHALAVTENVSYNYDFGFVDQYTWVDDQAYVLQTNGYASWSTFHVDWGEASELIFGITLLGWAWC